MKGKKLKVVVSSIDRCWPTSHLGAIQFANIIFWALLGPWVRRMFISKNLRNWPTIWLKTVFSKSNVFTKEKSVLLSNSCLIILVPDCPDAKLSGAKLSVCQIVLLYYFCATLHCPHQSSWWKGVLFLICPFVPLPSCTMYEHRPLIIIPPSYHGHYSNVCNRYLLRL